jgi:hypothetical protein
MRACVECGQRLPRPLPGAGRLQVYCSAACKQRAYRGRGRRASGTSGAAASRAARGNEPPGTAGNPATWCHGAATLNPAATAQRGRAHTKRGVHKTRLPRNGARGRTADDRRPRKKR